MAGGMLYFLCSGRPRQQEERRSLRIKYNGSHLVSRSRPHGGECSGIDFLGGSTLELFSWSIKSWDTTIVNAGSCCVWATMGLVTQTIISLQTFDDAQLRRLANTRKKWGNCALDRTERGRTTQRSGLVAATITACSSLGLKRTC